VQDAWPVGLTIDPPQAIAHAPGQELGEEVCRALEVVGHWRESLRVSTLSGKSALAEKAHGAFRFYYSCPRRAVRYACQPLVGVSPSPTPDLRPSSPEHLENGPPGPLIGPNSAPTPLGGKTRSPEWWPVDA
jgi:hypothetical protein